MDETSFALVVKVTFSVMGSWLSYILVKSYAVHVWQKTIKGKLRYGLSSMVLAFICFAATFTIVNAVSFEQYDYPTISILALAVCIGLAGLLLILDYFGTKGEFDERGLYFQSIWHGRRYYRWEDLIDVTHNSCFDHYVLSFYGKKSVRVSAYMQGYRELLEHIDSMWRDHEDPS
ncbi:hypothetical protein [Paraferrimonas haliotis]|uniref:Uncharacterized protein n=1 Tax=Paraferrimonas haliotis TaxID=2013866 RepID=A0AA37WXC0_9GAMM|nr:hypothetical protein [Paraferrimonas haliotis]GLS84408.1 hypothetical protein GCM10007894_23850 [Paraferrimonas haliotis]